MQILPYVVYGGPLCLLYGPSNQGRLRSLLLLPRTQGNGRCVRGLRQREQGGEQRERIRLRETIPRKHAREFVELGFSWLFSSKFQKALQVIDDWVKSTALVVCRAAKLDSCRSFNDHPVFERLHQPGLADTRLAAEQHHLTFTLPGFLPSLLQQS